MKRIVRGLLAFFIIAALIATSVQSARAMPASFNSFAAACNVNTASFFGFQPWWAYMKSCTSAGAPQLTSLTDLWGIGLALVGDGVLLTGYLAGVYVLWGGIQYVKSRGNASETAAAQTTILNAVIGLILAIISVAIVNFVAGRFTAS